MTEEQRRDLDRHLSRLNDQGERLDAGTIPWMLSEVLLNLDRIERLIGPGIDRISKKDLRPVLRDIRDQVTELMRRFR
jgi:hypothetical protein